LILQEDNGGKFKSTFFSALAGRGGGRWKFFTDAHIAVDNKDTWPIINRFWFIEWTEMAQLQRADSREAIKGFLSRGEDDFRPPYGRDTITWPRRSIFVGTTNQKEILENNGGNRRFWMIEDVGAKGKIDLARVAGMRDRLWAQAVAEFSAQYQIKKETGEYLIGNEGAKIGWWLEDESEKVQEELQKEYIREPISREIINVWLNQKEEVTVSQIINDGPKALQTFNYQGKRGQMEVAEVLKSLGWIKKQAQQNGIRVMLWARGPDARPKGSIQTEKAGVFSGGLTVVR
jgi:predicted P-loop ATPase